ncbi:MAG: periplasmic heavy metal sensor [Candidatus Marinimicrobia bacterium]|nr:periplasmic heavy metal sensor [Candidatus Neomarinimicrobiota bacterium]
MKTNITVLVIAMALISAPAGLFGHHGSGMGPGQGHGQMMGMKHDMIMSQLDLTEQQQQKMDEEHTQQMKKMIQLKADLQVAEIDLQNLIEEGAPESAVNRQVNQVADAQKAVLQAKSLHQLRVRGILGAEKFEQMMSLHYRGPGAGQGHPGMRQGQRHPEGMPQRGMNRRNQ